MLTRVFKSGNSMAVRIPKELAFAADVQDVEIERQGSTLVLRPAERESLGDLAQIVAMFSPDFMAGGRELNEQKERDWNAGWGMAESGTSVPSESPGQE
jgi:antitoxin VapB